jgi:hypothetical protein
MKTMLGFDAARRGRAMDRFDALARAFEVLVLFVMSYFRFQCLTHGLRSGY